MAILDDFNRANENPLSNGSKWSTGIRAGEVALKVVSNHVEASSLAANTENSSYWSADDFGPDCEVGFTILAKRGDAGDYYLRLWLRVTNPHIAFCDGYQALFGRESGVEEFSVSRILNAGGTVLVKTSQAFSVNDQIVFGAIGTQLYLNQNGAEVWSGTDSTWTAAGKVGMSIGIYTGASSSGPQLDDFVQGATVDHSQDWLPPISTVGLH